MIRIDVSTGVTFDEFIAAFEGGASIDPASVAEIAERDGSWDEVLAAAAINAPNALDGVRQDRRHAASAPSRNIPPKRVAGQRR